MLLVQCKLGFAVFAEDVGVWEQFLGYENLRVLAELLLGADYSPLIYRIYWEVNGMSTASFFF
jgi:hypothetical protein